MPKLWVGRTTLNGEKKEDFTKYKKKVTKFGLEILTGKAFLLSVWLEIIDDETGQKVFCLQLMQIKLKSCVTLFSWHVHISLNLNLIVFYRMVLSTKRIYNSFLGNFPRKS